jgi:hypothetical protein
MKDRRNESSVTKEERKGMNPKGVCVGSYERMEKMRNANEKTYKFIREYK